MNDDVNWLITIFYENYNVLIRCALKCKRNAISEDCIKYPLARENRAVIHAMLPEHVRTCGNIVDVEEVFDIFIRDDG